MMISPDFRSLWLTLRSLHAVRLIEHASALLTTLLWPRINDVWAARRSAFYGVPACLLIGGEWPFRHFTWPDGMPMAVLALEFPLGLAMVGVWLALAWVISTISKTGSLTALCLYLAMRIESAAIVMHDGGRMSLPEMAISGLLILTLANSVRGATAYRRLGFACQPGSGQSRL